MGKKKRKKRKRNEIEPSYVSNNEDRLECMGGNADRIIRHYAYRIVHVQTTKCPFFISLFIFCYHREDTGDSGFVATCLLVNFVVSFMLFVTLGFH